MLCQTKLPNGIRIITESFPHTQMTQIELWFQAGSQHENASQNGIAHCLEHMVFKGTPTRSAEEIDMQAEDIGGDLNASTGVERTVYEINVLNKYTEQGLSILADMVQNAVIDLTELKREKNVILQEIDTSLDLPTDVLDNCFRAVAYPNQAAGRSILGTHETLHRITRDDLITFRDKYYVGENLVISASGAVEHEAFVDLCYKYFKNMSSKRTESVHVPVQYVGGDTRIQRADNQINFLLGFNGFAITHPDHKALFVLASILGNGFSSRLYQGLREKRGLVYDIGAISESSATGGLFVISAATGAREIKELIPVLCDEISKVADTITDKEIERVRIKYVSELQRQMANPLCHASFNASDLVYKNRYIPLKETISKLNSVQKADVSRVARTIFQTKPTVAAIGPIQNMMSYDTILTRLGIQNSQTDTSTRQQLMTTSLKHQRGNTL